MPRPDNFEVLHQAMRQVAKGLHGRAVVVLPEEVPTMTVTMKVSTEPFAWVDKKFKITVEEA